MHRTCKKTLAMVLIIVLVAMQFPAYAHGDEILQIVSVQGETIWLHTSGGLLSVDAQGNALTEAIYPQADC